jgi:hypothetical protein
MVKISEMDEFLHADAVEDGEIVEITGKARRVSAEESAFDRAYLELPIKLSGGQSKIWTPNKTTLKLIAKAFGDDADFWVGKKVKLMISHQNVRGEMKDVIYGEPATQKIKQQQNLEAPEQ